jgi:hypothetical protein
MQVDLRCFHVGSLSISQLNISFYLTRIAKGKYSLRVLSFECNINKSSNYSIYSYLDKLDLKWVRIRIEESICYSRIGII